MGLTGKDPVSGAKVSFKTHGLIVFCQKGKLNWPFGSNNILIHICTHVKCTYTNRNVTNIKTMLGFLVSEMNPSYSTNC